MADTVWWPAPEADHIAQDLVPVHHKELDTLDARVVCLFRSDAQKLRGRECAATICVVSGVKAALAQINVPVWPHGFEADGKTPKQRLDGGAFFLIQIFEALWRTKDHRWQTALIDHELMHARASIKNEEKGTVQLGTVDHDYQGFYKEIVRYGLWDDQHKHTGQVFAPHVRAYLAEIDRAELEAVRSGGSRSIDALRGDVQQAVRETAQFLRDSGATLSVVEGGSRG